MTGSMANTATSAKKADSPMTALGMRSLLQLRPWRYGGARFVLRRWCCRRGRWRRRELLSVYVMEKKLAQAVPRCPEELRR